MMFIRTKITTHTTYMCRGQRQPLNLYHTDLLDLGSAAAVRVLVSVLSPLVLHANVHFSLGSQPSCRSRSSVASVTRKHSTARTHASGRRRKPQPCRYVHLARVTHRRAVRLYKLDARNKVRVDVYEEGHPFLARRLEAYLGHWLHLGEADAPPHLRLATGDHDVEG